MEGKSGLFSSRNESYSRDFLQKFAGDSVAQEQQDAAGGDSEEIELSLGLTLGGCYGADPKGKKLVRSSSIASLSVLRKETELPVTTTLCRTSSLPTETEEERRKRKELQSLKRLEAKRKRSEKRNSMNQGTRVEEEGNGGQSSVAPMLIKVGNFVVGHGFPGGGQFVGVTIGAAPPALPGWAASSGQVAPWPMALGSIGAQGSTSSGKSVYEAGPVKVLELPGFSNCTEAKNPSSFQPLPGRADKKKAAAPPASSVKKAVSSVGGGEGNAPKKIEWRVNGLREVERNMIEQMPCVSTKGVGPDGKRIEGFLYKYKKGEEVRIVCVCHGSFLTPAEFVKHAGGDDVEDPLKHIVVNTSPFADF